jgi:hypothetical protein
VYLQVEVHFFLIVLAILWHFPWWRCQSSWTRHTFLLPSFLLYQFPTSVLKLFSSLLIYTLVNLLSVLIPWASVLCPWSCFPS